MTVRKRVGKAGGDSKGPNNGSASHHKQAKTGDFHKEGGNKLYNAAWWALVAVLGKLVSISKESF